MVKPRYVFLIIVLNIGLYMWYSIQGDYKSVTRNMNRMDAELQTIIRASVDEAMLSEEMFTPDISGGITDVKSSIPECVELNLYRKDSGRLAYDGGGDAMTFRANMYAVAQFYEGYHRLPYSEVELFTVIGDSGTRNFFEGTYGWLFGDVYTREPNTEFQNFYDRVGQYITNDTRYMQYIGGEYSLSDWEEVPVLAQMGLKISDYNTDDMYASKNYKNVQKEGYDNSIYYLTPYSLGVTYIDSRLVKVCLLANMERMFRTYQADADGCKPTLVENLLDNTDYYHDKHDTTDSNYYVTEVEGTQIKSSYLHNNIYEVDMNSIDVDVTYSVVDFYDDANYELVSHIMGAGGTIEDRKGYPTRLKETDIKESLDGLGDTDVQGRGERVVAKVTVSFNMNLPYESAISKYYVQKLSTTTGGSIGADHLGIRGFNTDATGKSLPCTLDNEGNVRYEYTTYVALSR